MPAPAPTATPRRSWRGRSRCWPRGTRTEIVGFDRHLRRVLAASDRADLWGAAYLINGGCSDDGFEHFRGWLMPQGRATFAQAVREPDSLAELPAVQQAAVTGEEFEAEEVLTVAARRLPQATGDRAAGAGARAPTPELDDFWDFDDEDETRRRLPRLSALFVEPPD